MEMISSITETLNGNLQAGKQLRDPWPENDLRNQFLFKTRGIITEQ